MPDTENYPADPAIPTRDNVLDPMVFIFDILK
jgi:hypothetical protein